LGSVPNRGVSLALVVALGLAVFTAWHRKGMTEFHRHPKLPGVLLLEDLVVARPAQGQRQLVSRDGERTVVALLASAPTEKMIEGLWPSLRQIVRAGPADDVVWNFTSYYEISLAVGTSGKGLVPTAWTASSADAIHARAAKEAERLPAPLVRSVLYLVDTERRVLFVVQDSPHLGPDGDLKDPLLKAVS